MGVIIRDCKGMVVAASCKVLNGNYDAAITEAFAVDEGIRLAAVLELQHIIVESDSAGVVEAINESNCNGEYGMVIQGSLELLQTFRSWFVRYLKRDYNRAAHELAHLLRLLVRLSSGEEWSRLCFDMFCCWIGPKFNVVYVCFFSPSCCALLYFSFSVNELQVSVSKKKKKQMNCQTPPFKLQLPLNSASKYFIQTHCRRIK